MDAGLKFSRLVGALRAGEELAARVALGQSRLAPEPWMRRALQAQARQEQRHAFFAATVETMVGAAPRNPPVLGPLGDRLETDLKAGNFAASVLGLQGVLEHLGEALLERLGRHPHPAGTLLHELRERVLAQERGHTRLGGRCLAAIGTGNQKQTIADYEGLGLETARAVAGLLDDARIDPEAFWRSVGAQLASWRRAAGLLE